MSYKRWEMAENKDKHAHRFALSAIRGELLERERENVLEFYKWVTYYL